MKIVLLAAGYGTRLERDLREDTSGKYTHLRGVPKALLPIGDQPLASHWMSDIRKIPEVDKVFVLTNAANHKSFEEWSRDWPEVTLVCDGSTTNETRIGAVACMALGAKEFNNEDDVLFIGGDTLFYEDFNLAQFLSHFRDLTKREDIACLVTAVPCPEAEVHKHGIIEIDEDSRVTQFLEKPQPHETKSRIQCSCFYALSRKSLPHLHHFLEEKKDQPLKTRDATGLFFAYLYPKAPVYTSQISGRFDVGGLQSYIHCHEYFCSKS